MRMHKKRATLAVGAALVTGLSLVLSGVAQADSGARPGDVVGVGSDTLQNGADFVFDSAPGNTGGYNELLNKNRVFNDFATGDANGRAVYDGTCGTPVGGGDGLGTFCASTTNQTPNLLPGSIVLRDGSMPVTRPNGSGAGIAALIADSPVTGAGYDGLPTGSIQYSRASRLPNSTEEGNCPTTGNAPICGGLDVYQAATDLLGIAAESSAFGGTYAPAGLSAAELINIYTCTDTTWGQLSGYSGGTAGDGSAQTIHPLIPQSGSGTRNFFLADLQTANGGNAITLGACVRTVEEHDPTGIYGDPTPKDAIEPFSAGKIALINGTAAGLSTGYFKNGAGYSGTVNGTAAGQGAYTPGYLALLSGTPPDSGTNYHSSRGLYFVIRKSDESSTTPIQPGASQNWAEALFVGGTIADPNATTAAPPLIKSGGAGLLLQEAGFTPAYKSCGINPTTC